MTLSAQESLREAQRLLDADQYERAAEVLDPLVKQHNPEALFLRAQFTPPGAEDTTTFEKRHVRQLMEAEALGHAGAAYQLSIYTEEGDCGLVQDRAAAVQLIQRAADRGHPNAIWRVGVMLLYGTDGYHLDLVQGIALIKRAATLKSEGALRMLAKFYTVGAFGLAQSPEEAARLTQAAEADDVIPI